MVTIYNVHYSHMEELGELRVKVHMAGTRVTSSQPWRSHVRGQGVSELRMAPTTPDGRSHAQGRTMPALTLGTGR